MTFLSSKLESFRLHLAKPNALAATSALGLMTGLLAGLVIVAFRWLVEDTQDFLLPGKGADNYEAIAISLRFLPPLLGGIFLVLLFERFGKGFTLLGIARVIQHMNSLQSYYKVREFILQFCGAAAAIIGGFSVGREGPHVFLGAASGSLLGQSFAAPNNSIRILAGCGGAAGIAASFNTPLAGVAFAVEVIMMEYSVASFIPIILAAVSATAVSNVILGDDPAFVVPNLAMDSHLDLIFISLLGMLAGTFAAAFNQAVQLITRWTTPLGIARRLLLASFGMALIGTFLPQLMSIGYDTVNLALNSQLIGATLIVLLLLGKFSATALCIGCGVPGGMIGPVLFIGATLGSLFGLAVDALWPASEVVFGFYALMGMGAMMGASLMAPLAALTAMLELTQNLNVVMPGMLAVVTASLTARVFFHSDSLFVSMLKAAGENVQINPIFQTLRAQGVASLMETQFIKARHPLSTSQLNDILANPPLWLIVETEPGQNVAWRGADLANYFHTQAALLQLNEVDLADIEIKPIPLAEIDPTATLHEAWKTFEHEHVEALCVQRTKATGFQQIFGIVTKSRVEQAYQF